MTGVWFVSSGHGEPGASAGVALRTVASFFGGTGCNLEEDCASASSAQASTTSTTTIVFNWINGFMIFLSFIFPAKLVLRTGPEEAKTQRGNVPPDSDPLNHAELRENWDS